MLKLDWMELPRIYSQQTLYGAASEQFTFLVSDDIEEGIHASVKVYRAVPFDKTRYDLGKFDSVSAAKRACEQFKPQ